MKNSLSEFPILASFLEPVCYKVSVGLPCITDVSFCVSLVSLPLASFFSVDWPCCYPKGHVEQGSSDPIFFFNLKNQIGNSANENLRLF